MKNILLLIFSLFMFNFCFSMQQLPDGTLVLGGMRSKGRIQIQSPRISLGHLTLVSDNGAPILIEAFQENNKPILLINGKNYNPSLTGNYIIKDNTLYDAVTGRSLAYTQLMRNIYITGGVLLAVGSVVYVLHKTGVLEKVQNYIKQHPVYISFISFIKLTNQEISYE